MKFIEFKHRDNTKSLRCIETGWEISDNGEFPALWTNEDQGIFSKESVETYAQIKAKFIPEAEVKRPVMRRVEVLKYFPANPEKKIFAPSYKKDYEAWFHQFGLYSDEDTEPYSVAIVEKDDGSVDSIAVHLIRFIGAA